MQATIKQLELINTYSVNNVGDAAIYASLCHLAKKSGFKEVSAPQLSGGSTLLQTQLNAAITDQKNPKNLNSSYVSVGGDIFNNARPRLITRQFLKNLFSLKRHANRTAVFGQSIPRSCRGISFRLLASQLKKISSVVVRDQESFNRLQQLSVAAKLSYDTAFAAPICEEHQREVSSYFQLQYDLDTMALISLRTFDQMYPENNQRFLSEMKRLCALLTAAGFQVGIVLQSKVDDVDSDIAIIKELRKEQNIALIDPFVAHKALPHIAPWEITQAVIAQAKLVIGVRYHTAIFRLLGGKMPFSIFYSNKGQDLQQRLGIPGCSVADFVANEHFTEIIATQNQTFDPRVITQQVSNDFMQVAQRLAQQAAV